MSDYANIEKHSQGYVKSFFDSFVGTVVDLTQKFNKLNPQFLTSPDKVKAGMRNMGERLAKTLFQSGASEILGRPDLDTKNLDEAVLKNDFELIKGIRDKQGFLTQDGIEKFLHLLTVENDKRTDELMRIFLDYFIKSTKQEINMQDLAKQEVNGVEEIDNKSVFSNPVNFPVYFNGDINTVWQELWSRSQVVKPDYSIDNLALTPDLKGFFGPVGSAPFPSFRREKETDGLSLKKFYQEKMDHLNTLFTKNQKVPVINLLIKMEQKLSKSEISLSSAAKFIVYVRKISEPLKDKLVSDFDTWFESYSELNTTGEG